MKWLIALLAVLNLSACTGLELNDEPPPPQLATAQVGVVNHTGNYIYSASVNGAGGGKYEQMGGWQRQYLLYLDSRGLVSGHESSGSVEHANRRKGCHKEKNC